MCHAGRSRVEIRYVYNAARRTREVEETRQRCSSERDRPLTVRRLTTLQRDEHGNALGGIRLAEIAVPVANESAQGCGLGGTHLPFEAATLNRLYPTHADYVAKVTRCLAGSR